MERKLPPTAVVLGFVDCINRGDLDGLVAMMSEDHRLEVFDEEPVVGRQGNAVAILAERLVPTVVVSRAPEAI